MSSWLPTLLGIQTVLVLVLVSRHRHAWRFVRSARQPPIAAPRHWEKDDYWPFVTIVIDARASRVGPRDFEDRLCAWLSQDYPHFEILALTGTRPGDGADAGRDDVLRLACESGRMRRVEVDDVHGPADRTAFDAVRGAAGGQWLLFATDEVRCHRSAVTTFVRDALCRRADLLAIVPAIRRGNPRALVTLPSAALWLNAMSSLRDPHEAAVELALAMPGRMLLVRRAAMDELTGEGRTPADGTWSERTAVPRADESIAGNRLCLAAAAAGLRARVARGPRMAVATPDCAAEPGCEGWIARFRAAAGSRRRLIVRSLTWGAERALPPASVVAAAMMLSGSAPQPLPVFALWLGAAACALDAALDLWICRAVRLPLRWLALRPAGLVLTALSLAKSARRFPSVPREAVVPQTERVLESRESA